MAWPTPQEYNEAIQNPRTAFADAELKLGQPLLTPLGLPRPITGGFASVYQLICPGQRVYAVRCFLREYGDHQERYAAISDHLERVRLPYMVNFTFLPDGIRVGGRWYPILKMEWVEGETLHTYIERNLRSPAALLALAEQWVQMARTLRKAGIGHGDLQHGNVLVVNGQLRLIDYDGMFVPALSGRTSHEVGHRNYQHPDRGEALYDGQIDHFSTWVVYTSLVALSVEPRLWEAYQGGDECLIFRRDDFERPSASTLLGKLETSPDERLRRLAQAFHLALLETPERTPALDGPLAPGVGPLAGWVQDHMAAPRPARVTPVLTPTDTVEPSGEAPPADTPSSEPAWILDFIGTQAAPHLRADFQAPRRREQMVVSTSAVVLAASWLLAIGIGAPLFGPLVLTLALGMADLGFLATGFGQDPSVLALRTLRNELEKLQRAQRTLEQQRRAAERAQARIEADHERQVQRLGKRELRIQADATAATARYDHALARRLAELKEKEQRWRQRETEEIKAAEQALTQKLAAIDAEIANLPQAERDELQRRLQKQQEQFVANYLGRQSVEVALITNIGPAVKQRLRQHGIVRASDVTPARLAAVPGIGENRAAVLLDWRRKVEALARQAAPQGLSLIEESFIKGRSIQRRLSLERDKVRSRQKLVESLEQLRQQYASRYQGLPAQESEAQALHRRKLEETRQRRTAALQLLRQDRAPLDKATAAKRQEVADKLATVQRDLAQINWQLSNVERQLRQFEGIDFGSYLRQLLPR